MKWIQVLVVMLLALTASSGTLAYTSPADSMHYTGSRFDSLVAAGAARLEALIKANRVYEASGEIDRLQYLVKLELDDTDPADSTFFQRNAAGSGGYFEPGSFVFTTIADSLRKWNTENTIKSYMLYINGLFFALDKETKIDNVKQFFEQPDEKFSLNTDRLKEAHADITKAIFDKVVNTDALRRVTVLFSVGAYQTNAVFKVRLSGNGTPTDSTWVQEHLLLTAYPKAGNLAETDDRKKLITLVHSAMLYEKPAFTNAPAALNDERIVIGGALKRVLKHKQILASTTPNQLDDIFKDFLQADYIALTLPERLHALKIMAGGTLGNNLYNSREAYAVMMVQHTPDAQQKGLLDALMIEKATGSSNVLLKDLVNSIDNGHFVSASNDLDEFITSLAKFIYRKYPPVKSFTLDSALLQQRAIGIKPGFWFGDDVGQSVSSTGVVALVNLDRRVNLRIPAYAYVYLTFNGTFTLGDKTYRKNEQVCVPAIIAQLVFNNHNSSKIKAGMKTVFDLALLLTGVGELKLALEAKNAWPVAKALWNMGWGVSDFFVNGIFAEKLSETESGRKFLLWYNRVQLVAGGIGMTVSIYDIRQGIKNSRKEFEEDLLDNKLKRELEYGNSEVQVTNAEKDDIINNLKREEDDARAKLNMVENAGEAVPSTLISRLTQAGTDKLKAWTSGKASLTYRPINGNNLSGANAERRIFDDLEASIGNRNVLETLEDAQGRLIVVLERPGQTHQVVTLHPTSTGEFKMTTFEPAYNPNLNPSIPVPASANRLVPDYAGTKYLHPSTQNKVITIEMKGNRNADFKAANEGGGFGSTYDIPTYTKPDGTIVQYTWHHLDDFKVVNGKFYCTMQLVEKTAHGGTGVTGMAHTGSVAQWKAYFGSGY